MNYNTTKVELQEPVTQTFIVIRIEQAATKNQSYLLLAKIHKSVSSSSSLTEWPTKVAGKSPEKSIVSGERTSF